MIIVQNFKEENERYWVLVNLQLLSFKIYTITKPNNVKIIIKNIISDLGKLTFTAHSKIVETYTVSVSRKFDNLKLNSGDSNEHDRILKRSSTENTKYIINGIDGSFQRSENRIEHYKNLLYYEIITQEQYDKWARNEKMQRSF